VGLKEIIIIIGVIAFVVGLIFIALYYQQINQLFISK